MPASKTLSVGWHLADGFYRDARLETAGIPHGVTTRQSGNMKDPERRARVVAAAGLGARRPLLLKQVHGTEILEAASFPHPGLLPQAGEGKNQYPSPPEGGVGGVTGDGWICADAASLPCVFVADCLPIFVWDDRGKAAVGVFHAGWRGLASGMPRAAVRAFRRYGLTPDCLAASVGPHIGACCYAVGPEVAQRFHPEVMRFTSSRLDSLPQGERENKGAAALDLGEEARLQLMESGISADRISVSTDCTSCMADTFFSYRREKMDLRMMAFIAFGGTSRAH